MPRISVFSRVALPAGISLLLIVEFLLFDQCGAHHHTWVYPRWNDQIQYLTESYLGHENARAHGLFVGLRDALTNPSAQGTLHDFWAILIFSVTGASRSSALAINMLAFLAWQLAVFTLVLRRSRSRTLAFLAAILLLAIKSPWEPIPGSAFDFRLDWMAACAMGIALVAAEATDRFKRPLASVGFGIAVSLVLLTRFLTGTYFVLIYLAFFCWAAASSDRWRRIGNVALSGVVVTALAGPVMWLNREQVYNYYLIGHFTGPESAIRSRKMGVLRSTNWLFSHLAQMHVGTWLWCIWGLLGISALVLWLLWPARPHDKNFEVVPQFPSFVPALVFLFAPALILILHIQKSEYVLGILLPGLVGCAWLLLLRPLKACRQSARRVLAAACGAIVLANFGRQMSRDPHSEAFATQARHVDELADYIAARCEKARLTTPRVAVDRVTDCLDAQVLRVICYERQHRWIPFVMTLPTGIWEEKDSSIFFERIAASDFVFLTESGDSGTWPYDRQLATLRAKTFEWADTHMKRVGGIDLPGAHMVLFERTDLASP